MILDKINQRNIQVGVYAENWEDAVKKSAAPLVENAAIESSYIEAIINSVKKNGPYFVITKHIALAHARPEYGVNRLDLSFTVLEKPVEFGSELFDPIKLIITLAATDASSHLDLLSELTDVLIDDELLGNLYKAKTSGEFYKLLTSSQ